MNTESKCEGITPELQQEINEQLAILERRQSESVFEHPLWENATRNTLNSISYWEPGCMSAIVGPTGVGKSTLLKELEKLLKKELRSPSQGEMPVLRVEAIPAPNSPFSWKEFYLRVLGKVNSPLADERLERPNAGRRQYGKGWSDGDLRREFENALAARRTKVLMIDEAHHIGLGRTAQSMLTQLEVLKSIGNTSELHLVLSGPYELLSKISLNGHLSRRISIIHFPRYKKTEEDLGAFRDALCQLAEDLAPWTIELDLEDLKIVEYFFVRSVGCIGILRPWLLRAVRNSARMGSWKVTFKELDAEAKTPLALDVILTEILDGETKLGGLKGNFKGIENKLNGDAPPPAAASTPPNNQLKNDEPKPAKPPRPGEALPRRYPNDPPPDANL